jgi:hypothetical protein
MPTFDTPVNIALEAKDQMEAWDSVRLLVEHILEKALRRGTISAYDIGEPIRDRDFDDVAADEAGVG